MKLTYRNGYVFYFPSLSHSGLTVLQAQAKAQLAANNYERLQLRVGSSRGSTGPDPRRQGSVASFQESEGAKEMEAPIRSSAPGSGATVSFVRRQRTVLCTLFFFSKHVSRSNYCSALRQPHHSTSPTVLRYIFSLLRNRCSARRFVSCRSLISR